ncbi:4-carboxymuconolactone decarboxylase [Nocardioides salarius]|uniref:4-carboxymuconolactone decarboxylase n=1 Tax=Nocardioides salarius TaxID=374513 RepID=A0ABS2MA42_9ACTN|nr:carboxymuconolactone decarboxylase family protein [Nocardioides salarius]MBM7508063.1 4-carboxymuconolactone decarboxylase [Nocardioides salarius]
MDLDLLAGHNDPQVRAGLSRRRAVLGDDYTLAAIERSSPLAEELQVWVTRDVWGSTWERPALDLPSRSLVTLALLVAGGHQQELAAHVRGALRNGLRAEQVLELVRHCAAYCGAPVALAAMRTVAEVLEAHANGSPPTD